MKQRITTGLIAGTGFIGLAFIGGWPYITLLLILSIVGYMEFVRMNGLLWHHPAALTGCIGMLAIAFPWNSIQVGLPSEIVIVWLLMFTLFSTTVVTKNKTTLDHVALLMLGAVYIGIGFSSMMTVRGIEEYGRIATFLAFGCIWASDIGAYFSGRAFGRHKLWPSISPNKTVEGAVGGILLAFIVAAGVAVMVPEWMPLGKALMIGLLSAVAGQLGDLIQSAYKRIRGIKDTGTILPGHGGVLDRVDSWLIVFPILTLTGLLT
ncbi:phosphatidate cytidylyltransferase [Paenibacillus tarimensis]